MQILHHRLSKYWTFAYFSRLFQHREICLFYSHYHRWLRFYRLFDSISSINTTTRWPAPSMIILRSTITTNENQHRISVDRWLSHRRLDNWYQHHSIAPNSLGANKCAYRTVSNDPSMSIKLLSIAQISTPFITLVGQLWKGSDTIVARI
jgi:hypothetical protein